MRYSYNWTQNEETYKSFNVLSSLIEYLLTLGVLFRGEFAIPKDCKGDALCEVSKNVTKDEKTERKFVLEGGVTSSGFELKAMYQGNWKIGENVVIPGVSLVIKVGKETKIYFEVTVNILQPKLELQGKSCYHAYIAR